MAATVGLMRKVENLKFRMDSDSGSNAESYFEVQDEAGNAQQEKIFISGISGVHSTGLIAKRMRDRRGIFLLSLRDVAKSEELRPCLERIKKDCRDNQYELAVIDNEWIMMLPKDSGVEMVFD